MMQMQSARLVAERAQSRGEIPATHDIAGVNKLSAGITEVLTQAGGRKPDSTYAYRYLIDSYTGVNLNGPGKEASRFDQGLGGPAIGGKVEIEGENVAAACLRLIDAGFGQGHLLRIHVVNHVYGNKEENVKEDKDLRKMTESEVADLVLELSTQI